MRTKRLASVPVASPVRWQWLALWLAVALLPCAALAAKEPAAGKDKRESKETEEIPKPEDLALETGDGVELALTYYPGAKGKETIPIVLLHMWKLSRNDFKELALALQSHGYAVVAPDLRGHGESTRLKDARRDETLDAATMSPQQFRAMVMQDMKAVKNFLWEQNNAGKLNIDKLCVVGAEMGASVALNFAAADALVQDRNRVLRSDYQIGRFVKALVLISPEWSFRGLPIRNAAAYPAVQEDIALLILVGKKDARALEEAKRIHGLFERSHPEPAGDDKIDKMTLFLGKLDTSLQGTKLLDPQFNLPSIIADFIHRRLEKSAESKEWGWKERKVPHQ